jgi:hypothetical protein
MKFRKSRRRENWRRGWESNPRIKVLQTSPLPLGYRASTRTTSITKLQARFSPELLPQSNTIRKRTQRICNSKGTRACTGSI